MGLLDVLNGMQNGPRGASAGAGSSTSGGLSPLAMALLGLLAYKALKSFGGQPSAAGAGTGPGTPATPAGPSSGGGLGDLLKGGLGGLLAGGAAGSVLSGGLGDLLRQFEQSGKGEVANSWVGSGPNKAISPDDLENALGADRINALASYSGLSRDELLHGLSQQLPELVDRLTPHGRLPTEHEAGRLV